MVTYLGGSILITIFVLSGSIVSYNLHLVNISGNELISSLKGNPLRSAPGLRSKTGR